MLFFYETDISSGALQFKEDNRAPQDKGFFLGFAPQQLYWDGDRIYVASKKGYVVMNKLDGNIIYKLENDSKGKRTLEIDYLDAL